MQVLVDTSAWVNYFRTGDPSGKLDLLIDENLIVTNDLILSELIPFLRVRNQRKLIRLLDSVDRLDLDIDWREIQEFQFHCLKKGANGIGIPDLIIAQNAKQNHCEIFTRDDHFMLMKDILGLRLIV
jgi:predicted nucleic acid-binding protein